MLRSEEDLPSVTDDIARQLSPGSCVIAVVSAFEGRTTALIELARIKGLSAQSAKYAKLVSAGEHESAAALHLALADKAISAEIGTPKRIGLLAEGARDDSDPVFLDRMAVAKALCEAPVLIVPGFCAVDLDGGLMLLGRGGSDLTAIHLAAGMGIEVARLVKDVDAVYDRDPNESSEANRLLRIDYEMALKVSGGLIQPKALRFAEKKGVAIEIGALGSAPGTLIA